MISQWLSTNIFIHRFGERLLKSPRYYFVILLYFRNIIIIYYYYLLEKKKKEEEAKMTMMMMCGKFSKKGLPGCAPYSMIPLLNSTDIVYHIEHLLS